MEDIVSMSYMITGSHSLVSLFAPFVGLLLFCLLILLHNVRVLVSGTDNHVLLH